MDPIGTSGKAVGPSIMIIDDAGQALPLGQKGDILVRGPPCFGGYEGDQSFNDEAFLTVDGVPGWFNTGDVGCLDKNGYLFISGRSKEIINRGGETISPFEIEEAIVQQPDVKEVLAFSAPHETYQETVGIVLVSKSGSSRLDLPAVWTYIENKLHRSKWPQVIIFMDNLPKNAANKILRIKIAERTGMKDIAEDDPPQKRLYEGKCPPVGTPLTTPILITPIEVCAKQIKKVISSALLNNDIVVITVDLPFKPVTIVSFVDAEESDEDIVPVVHAISSDKLHTYERPAFIHKLKDAPSLSLERLRDLALSLHNRLNIVSAVSPTEVAMERVWREFLNSQHHPISGK
jgi:hypothetical protein